MSKIKSVNYIGKHQTYDLELDHKDHQFYLSNGLLTSNSHAISYAYNSYICAWLFHNYPGEWICATLENEMKGKQEEKAEVLSSLLSMGYNICLPNINASKDTWTYDDKNILAPLNMIKSLGDVVGPLLYENRPFLKIEDLLNIEKIPAGTLNKTKLEVLCMCGALNDLIDERFENDNHFYNFLSEYRAQSKKKKYSVDSHIESLRGKFSPFTKEEKINFKLSLMGYYDLNEVIPDKAKKTIREERLPGISDIVENNLTETPFWFVATTCVKKTSKTNNNYYEITGVDFSFKSFTIRVFGLRDGFEIVPNCGYIAVASKISESSIMVFKSSENISRIF